MVSLLGLRLGGTFGGFLRTSLGLAGAPVFPALDRLDTLACLALAQPTVHLLLDGVVPSRALLRDTVPGSLQALLPCLDGLHRSTGLGLANAVKLSLDLLVVSRVTSLGRHERLHGTSHGVPDLGTTLECALLGVGSLRRSLGTSLTGGLGMGSLRGFLGTFLTAGLGVRLLHRLLGVGTSFHTMRFALLGVRALTGRLGDHVEEQEKWKSMRESFLIPNSREPNPYQTVHVPLYPFTVHVLRQFMHVTMIDIGSSELRICLSSDCVFLLPHVRHT